MLQAEPTVSLAADSARETLTSSTMGSPSTHPGDPLLECLLIVARAHGRSPTRDTVMAGLPVHGEMLPPHLVERAARRIGLSSRLVRASPDQINARLLPAIILLHDQRACVVLGRGSDPSRWLVIEPELPETPVEILTADLSARSAGHMIYLRPRHRLDARVPPLSHATQGHWFWSVIRDNRALYRDVLLAALLANLFALGMPLFTMNVYDRVVPNQAFDTLWVLAIGVAVVLVGDLVFRVLRSHFVDLAGSRADLRLSSAIMEHVLGLRMEHRPTSAGSFAAQMRAFESVRDFIGSATVTAFIDLPFALVFALTIAWIAGPMVLPLVVGACLALGYAALVQGRLRHLAERAAQSAAQRNATLVEGLVGFETVKSLAAESVIQRTWELNASVLARIGQRLRTLATTSGQVGAFVQQGAQLAIIVLGVYLIADGGLTLGGLIACTMLASRAMAPIGQAAGLMVQYHSAATALGTLNQLMARESERPATAGFLSRGPLQGAIELRNLSFTYPGQSAPALRDVSLSIKPGERVAVLGRIGSGKSTLARLILGLYRPTQGAVCLDGVDLAQLDPSEVRRQIGYVPQDVVLFFGSLRENIGFGAPLAEHAHIVTAASAAGLTPHVDRHPQGFDMQVGERGEALSGGQRQAVAIARAVVNDPPILLLDEPTASMDHSSEEAIKQRLAALAAAGRTTLIITHRNSMLDLVDRLIVMDGGRIVADGPKGAVVTALREGRVGKGAW